MSIIKRVVATWPWILSAAIFSGVVSVTPRLWQLEHWGLLTGAWGALALTVFCLVPTRLASWRGLYPLLLVVWLGLLWPLLHSIGLVFWHFDSAHALSLPAAQQELLQEMVPSGIQMDKELVRLSDHQFFIRFWPAGANDITDEEFFALIESRSQPDRLKAAALYHTPPLKLQADDELTSLPEQTVVVLQPGPGPTPSKEESLVYGHHFKQHLNMLRFVLPNGQTINGTKPRYQAAPHPASAYALQEISTGNLVLPNPTTGFFQSQNKAGQWMGEPVRPGFVYWAGWDNWHFWGPHLHILLKQTLWSLLLASLAVGLAALSATAWVACLRHVRYPNLAMYLLVLPAAVPLALLAYSMQVLFANQGEVNQFLHLISGWVPEWRWWESGPAHLSLLMAAWWWLSPLFTLWFFVLGQGQRAWPGWHKAGPGLILTWISLLSVPTLIACFTGGRPDFFNTDFGHTDVLISLMQKMAFESRQQYSAAIVPLLLLLPIVLAANGWRLKLLQTQQRDISSIVVPVRRGWSGIGGVLLGILLHALPLLLLFLVSFHLSNVPYEFADDAWRWLSREGLSLRHWYGVFGLGWVNSFGMLERPNFPVWRWIANSWLWALLHGAICLGLAASAVYALRRMSPQHSKKVRLCFYWLQGLLPSLGLVGIFSLLWSIESPLIASGFAGHLYLVLGLAAAIMWVEPLFQQVEHTGALQAHWRLCAALFLLGLILQLGEYPLAQLLFSDDQQLTLPVGAMRTMSPSFPKWGQLSAMVWLYSLPIMALLGLLIPLLNRQVVQHWRP